MTTAFLLKTILVVLNLGLLGAAAYGLTLCLRPQRPAAWIAGGVISAMVIVIVISEAIGRFAYEPVPLTLGMAAAAMLGAVSIYLHRGRLSRPAWPAIEARGAMLAVVCVVLSVWAGAALWMFAGHVLLPPIAPDALVYHLTGPAFWVNEGQVGKIEGADMRINFFPHNMSLLWGWTLALTHGDYLGGIFPVLTVFLLWPTTVYLIATHFGARRDAALIFSVMSGATSIILMQGMNEGVDVLFWGSALLALYAAFAGKEGFGRGWLAVGLAAGLTLGTKVYGVVTGSLVLLVWFALAAYRIQAGDRKWLPLFWRSAASGLLALAVGGWVLVENTLIYGNPIFPYPFVIDFEPAPTLAALFRSRNAEVTDVTSLQALWAVIASTPQLLLGLAPLDSKYGAYSSGFGYMSPAITLTALVLAVVAAFHFRKGAPGGARILHWLGFCAAVLAIHALLASQWGVMLITDIGAGYTSAGRYQLFWAALTAVTAALLFPAAWRWRAAAALPALAVFICAVTLTVENGSKRNWTAVSSLIGLFPDRLAQTEGLYRRMTPELAEVLKARPDANLLEFSRRSLIYHYFYPSFDRYVHTRRGYDMATPPLEHWTMDDAIYRAYENGDRRALNTCRNELAADADYIPDGAIRFASVMLMDQIMVKRDIGLVLMRPSGSSVRGWLWRDPALRPVGPRGERRDQGVFERLEGAEPRYDKTIACLQSRSDAYREYGHWRRAR